MIKIPISDCIELKNEYLKSLEEIPPGGRVYGKGWIDCLRYLYINHDLEFGFVTEEGKVEKIRPIKSR